ncbi:MAG: hypothetical protein V1720_14825 [bacterium]
MKGYIPSNLYLGASRRSDKYSYIITLIYYGRIFNKELESDSFIPLNGKILLRLLGGRYKAFINYLLNQNILETDGRYIIGEKSKGYRLTKQFREQKSKEVTIKDEKLLSKISMFKEMQKKQIKLDHHFYLYNCLQDVTIQYDEAKYFIERNVTDCCQYVSYNISVDMIESKSFFFTVDSTAGRVHNNITNLSRDLRPFLRWNDKGLVEIDIANSQPFLFNILIDTYYKSMSVSNSDINLSYGNQNIEKMNDIQRYRYLTSNGIFYEYLMDKMEVKEDRQEFKIRFFSKIFFSKDNSGYVTDERRQFKKLFPYVSEIVSYYKKNDYRKLAISLQRAEAEIIINKVVPKLAEKGIYVLTIHDSILTTTENVKLVEQTIKEEFKNNYNLYPTIKIK